MSTKTYLERVLAHSPSPDFGNLQKVLKHMRPNRATLFEFFLNYPLYQRLSGVTVKPGVERTDVQCLIGAFRQAGYDYVTYRPPEFAFPRGERPREKTVSINEGGVIADWASFEKCPWKDPDTCNYSQLKWIQELLPDGMKVVVCGPGGVLENVIALVGYERLCFMLADDPGLAHAVFDAVGSRLVRHYEIAGGFESVGACISNDDWGFKTQPMLAPQAMREYVFPWHVKIVQAIHHHGKPAILHSCGNAAEIMQDITDAMEYDGKHSFEDAIEPVEDAYRKYGRRIALLGGIDVDFVCRASPDEVYRRSKAMLDLTAAAGSYALGTGNSVPEYVPTGSYCAMIWAALEAR
ncbi:MAG: hypothetical protein A3K19_05880 [Lentisphaerae bacterium RIFOXYB12_FULL_65_16]|nr:MAG: hypothetical protein A3K18_15495 [Lentisphaerae bacterium RIFOXYA12_64_32]OGV95102.1 MAG: hypothetical protein A3K19_05880 [Lentisphaerae bacterium RIFOXYB12_FULL_65_16]